MTPTRLTILYLDNVSIELGVNLDMLHDHLGARGRGDIKLHIHTLPVGPSLQEYDFIFVLPDSVKGKDAIIQYVIEQNIDIIHDPYQAFNDKERWAQRDKLYFTTSMKDLYTQIEAYLAGLNVAWLMEDPIFNLPWIMKYERRGGLTNKAFRALSTAQEKGYSSKQLDYVRALLNKIMHIEYARDQLYYFLILKRRSSRNGSETNYKLELTYHLTNYTFSICSVMDIFARLLNDRYGLGYGQYQNYGIEKTEFISKLAAKRKSLAHIFNLKKYNGWAELIKVRRNEFTHSSHIYLTPMLMEKKQPLSDEELEALVDQTLDWELIKSSGMEETIAGMRATIKQNLAIEHNYDVVAEDIMTLEKVDKSTGQMRQYVVKPLNAIDQDFEKISEIIERTFDNLSHARQ